MICKEARRFLLSLNPQNGETEKQKKKKGHEQMDYNTPHATEAGPSSNRSFSQPLRIQKKKKTITGTLPLF